MFLQGCFRYRRQMKTIAMTCAIAAVLTYSSPVGSVARDPLSILIGQDDILWARLGLTSLFWWLVAANGGLAWRRRRA